MKPHGSLQGSAPLSSFLSVDGQARLARGSSDVVQGWRAACASRTCWNVRPMQAFLKALVRSDKELRGRQCASGEGLFVQNRRRQSVGMLTQGAARQGVEGHSSAAFVTGQGQFTRPDFSVED